MSSILIYWDRSWSVRPVPIQQERCELDIQPDNFLGSR